MTKKYIEWTILLPVLWRLKLLIRLRLDWTSTGITAFVSSFWIISGRFDLWNNFLNLSKGDAPFFSFSFFCILSYSSCIIFNCSCLTAKDSMTLLLFRQMLTSFSTSGTVWMSCLKSVSISESSFCALSSYDLVWAASFLGREFVLELKPLSFDLFFVNVPLFDEGPLWPTENVVFY